MTATGVDEAAGRLTLRIPNELLEAIAARNANGQRFVSKGGRDRP